MISDQIKEYINSVNARLMERFDNREKLLLMSRELIRYCGETVSLSHRGEKERALKRYQDAIKKSKEIEQVVSNFPELLYGDVGTAFQELAEASVVISMYFGEKLNLASDLGVPDTYYITGIADSVGEMRRRVLELLKEGKNQEAEKTYRIMEDIYQTLWNLEYPKSVVPGLRQKVDALRRILEETYHDIFLASLRISSDNVVH
ncbi:haloacid dehalogenase [Sulfuracidifex metallicus]|uniref:Haloacid dehalogenase n=2 Tax=Sulfuracidifex metallicus TaxID=47303 RepID=A0A6A9QKE1_SULME|nr:haloacid dehalogenase [Sulfuracidifex metallicus]MUN28188.1 haloacid dehalogenase [Sulfuracidifex metallicus DSM 6482 = JCM 9184]WOE51277.1 haloacid dehalogenase [Sulfuracidifex metallicus DSM 6482 = JCM 9184]